jgi:uncharacterized protein (TIGR02466 family)
MIINSLNFKEDIGLFKREENFDEQIKQLYKLKKQENSTDSFSNKNGWQKEIIDREEYIDIQKIIMNEFVNYFKKNIGIFKLKVEIIKFFVNINPPNAYHVMHFHEGGHFSGAFWLQADKDAGNLMIMNPFPNNFMANFTGKLMSSIKNFNHIQITPKSNLGVFFNSNIIHYVDVNRSKRDRIGFGYHIKISDK